MSLDLTAIKARVAKLYVFDQPGDVVVTPTDDVAALLAHLAATEARLARLEAAGKAVVDRMTFRGDPDFCRVCEFAVGSHESDCPIELFAKELSR